MEASLVCQNMTDTRSSKAQVLILPGIHVHQELVLLLVPSGLHHMPTIMDATALYLV